MVGTIDEFRANFIGGGARPNQFRVEIQAPPGISIGLDTRNATFWPELLRCHHKPWE